MIRQSSNRLSTHPEATRAGFSVKVAKLMSGIMGSAPGAPEANVGKLAEVFRHDFFLNASEDRQREIMLESSRAKYLDESSGIWDYYFGIDLEPYLKGKHALDLGCGNGGRGIAWYEHYKLASISGTDISPINITSASNFAQSKGVIADYRVGAGEDIPFDSQSFEAVLSFDTFEHVRSVERTLVEARRVLKPGGRLFVVFPGFFHPIEHHLRLVTRMPFIHYFFSGTTLIQATNKILEERGPESYWYRRANPELESWERGNTINGMTARCFRQLVKRQDWRVVFQGRVPVGGAGTVSRHHLSARLLSHVLAVFARLPVLEEMLLHRISYILEKPPVSSPS